MIKPSHGGIMNALADLPIGRRVAAIRKLRGLTQSALASRLHRSESWVTKIERGERSIDSLAVLRELASALSVPLRQLADQDPSSLDEGGGSGSGDLAELRRLLDLPATISREEGELGSVADLERDAQALRAVYDTARYNVSVTVPKVPGLIRRARLLSRAAPAADRLRAHAVLVPLYRLISIEFHRRGDMPRARAAIDRALMDADHSGDPRVVGAAGSAAVAFMVQSEPAEGMTAAGEFIDLVARDPLAGTAVGTAVLGALYSVGALAAARAGDQKEAQRLMASAGKAADALGRDGTPHGVYFGPAYSAIHETRFLVEIGHPRKAAQLGEKVQLGRLANVNRAGFHAAYLARAQSMCGQQDDALASIAVGLRIAPEMFRDHAQPGAIARDVLRSMLDRRRHADERLRRVARRLGLYG